MERGRLGAPTPDTVDGQSFMRGGDTGRVVQRFVERISHPSESMAGRRRQKVRSSSSLPEPPWAGRTDSDTSRFVRVEETTQTNRLGSPRAGCLTSAACRRARLRAAGTARRQGAAKRGSGRARGRLAREALQLVTQLVTQQATTAGHAPSLDEVTWRHSMTESRKLQKLSPARPPHAPPVRAGTSGTAHRSAAASLAGRAHGSGRAGRAESWARPGTLCEPRVAGPGLRVAALGGPEPGLRRA